MKKLVIALVVLLILAGIGAGFAKWGVSKYNGLVVLGQGVDKQWGQVENVLQRRNDLIPNLVNVVQAYAVQEQEVFIKVAEARNMWMKATQGGTVSDKIKADGAVSGALLNLMAVVEKYPDLKSNQNFMALQDELAGTENRIAVERMRYNEEVQKYNSEAKQFPTNFIVSFFKFPAERDYFKSVEGAQKAPEVKFTYPGVPVPGVPPSGQQPVQAAPAVPQAIPAPAITPPLAPATTTTATSTTTTTPAPAVVGQPVVIPANPPSAPAPIPTTVTSTTVSTPQPKPAPVTTIPTVNPPSPAAPSVPTMPTPAVVPSATVSPMAPAAPAAPSVPVAPTVPAVPAAPVAK